MERVQEKPKSIKLFLVLFVTGLVLVTVILLTPLVFLYLVSPLLSVAGGLFLATLFSFLYIYLDKKNNYILINTNNKLENFELVTLSLSVLYQYLSVPFLFQALIYYTGLDNFFFISIIYLALVTSFFYFVFYHKKTFLIVNYLAYLLSNKKDRENNSATKKIRYLFKTPL